MFSKNKRVMVGYQYLKLKSTNHFELLAPTIAGRDESFTNELFTVSLNEPERKFD